ncbi:MAG: hypothetical protein HZA04_02715 [Nitrospinae bacterium]|nr:hypothetical protein [Nitrospinota bacterium]
MSRYERKPIQLTQLLLDPQNARHGVKNSQPEIVEWMLKEIKDKIYSLAKDIVEHGMSPIDGVFVYPSEEDDGHFIVAEGNRRITALQLLLDVDKCPDELLKKKLKQLKESPSHSVPDEIECVIAEDFDAAQHWVRLRHGGEHEGAGTVPWGAEERERFNQRIGHAGQDAYAIKVLDWAKENALVANDQVKDFPITNLTRLLNDTAVRDLLGLIIEGDALKSVTDDSEIGKALKRMILDLAGGKKKVDDIKSKDQRETYVKKLVKETLFDSSKKAAIPFVLDGDPEKSGGEGESAPVAATTRQTQRSIDRKKLIPKQFKIEIVNKKLNAIYHELRSLTVEEYPNAVSVLFRVFFEGCVDAYKDKHKLAVKASSRKGATLKEKTTAVLQHLASKGTIDKNVEKAVNKALSNDHHFASIDTFHTYVHNYLYQASPKDLKRAWDNLEGFFSILEGSI